MRPTHPLTDSGNRIQFVQKLRQGFDLVQSCRLPSGGGLVSVSTMPFSHRWLGNPLFSLIARPCFRAPIPDASSARGGFPWAASGSLQRRVARRQWGAAVPLQARLYRYGVAEIPITLYPDCRKSHPPHLRTIRDGWRTL